MRATANIDSGQNNRIPFIPRLQKDTQGYYVCFITKRTPNSFFDLHVQKNGFANDVILIKYILVSSVLKRSVKIENIITELYGTDVESTIVPQIYYHTSCLP